MSIRAVGMTRCNAKHVLVLRFDSKVDRVSLRAMLSACDLEPRDQRMLLTACTALVKRISQGDDAVTIYKLLGELPFPM